MTQKPKKKKENHWLTTLEWEKHWDEANDDFCLRLDNYEYDDSVKILLADESESWK